MFGRKLRYPIAVDMSGGHVYAAQLRTTRKGPAIRGLFYQSTGPGSEGDQAKEEELVGLLRKIAVDRCFCGNRTVLQLPSADISSFPIRFEPAGTETLEEAIVRESKEYISFPLNEAVIDYASLIPPPGREKGEYKAIVLAVRRENIYRNFRIFRQAGLMIAAVDFDVSSLIRLHRYAGPASKNPVILCNIDHKQTIISVVTSEGILAEHHISWGFDHLLDKVRSNLELPQDDKKTKALLQKYGLIYTGRPSQGKPEISRDESGMCRIIHQIIVPYIEELIDEFHKVTVYLRSEEKTAFIEKVHLYGWANFIQELDRYLEGRLNIPVSTVNPLKDFGFDPEAEDTLPDPLNRAPYALALGLALRRVAWF